MNILITGVGGPTPRSIARSLKFSKRFGATKLYGTDINPLAHGLYQKELYEKTHVIPRADDIAYWDVVEKIIRKYKIDLALVHPELEVDIWSERQAMGLDLPCKALLPFSPLVKLLLNKSKMTDALKGTGLVPDSCSFHRKKLDMNSLEGQLDYPFWVRSEGGSSGLGSLLIHSKEELENWIVINENIEHFIASTYLPGRNLCCKLLYWNGKLLRAASGQRVEYIMSKVAPSGITGNTSFGRLLNEPKLVETADRAMQILFKQTGAVPHGFFTADFKEDETGKPYITEINVRMVAFNHAFAQAGANFSEDITRLLSEEPNFDYDYKMYEFEPHTIFLRDVDADPIVMNEYDIKREITPL